MIIVLPTPDGYLIGLESDVREKSPRKRRGGAARRQERLKLHTVKRQIVHLRKWMRLSHRDAN